MTFHSIGLYWAPAGGSASRLCNVQYRRINQNEPWKAGYPLWFDSRNNQYRGSLVLLQPGTTYEIKLDLTGSPATAASLNATTWSETFPVGTTVPLPATSTSTLTIAQSGTPGGYRLYTAAPNGSTIDVANAQDQNIVITDASYIIIRGLTLRRARVNAIELRGNVHDVVIEENDISGWGRVAPDGWGEDYDGAIYSTSPTLKTIIVQRNSIHHPRSDANSWEEPRPSMTPDQPNHPLGPQAVVFFDSLGNHVLRYNTVFSDEDHRFNDVFGAGDNHSPTAGFPAVDSDIYGNRISECWDDAIESEGANRNVRIWGNFIDNTFSKIAVASTQVGPVYVFRNISGVARRTGTDVDPNWDTVGRGSFLKTKDFGGGKVFAFHNTVLQPPPLPGFTWPRGADPALGCCEGMTNVFSRNNILQVYKDWHQSIADNLHDPQGDYDYDLYNGVIEARPGQEINGKHGVPVYASGNGPGEFALAPNSLGFDQGVVLPGFNDDYTGSKPDMGAFEAGSPPMEFGVDAYRNPPAPLALPARINAGGAPVASYIADTNFAGGSIVTNWTGAIDLTGVVDPAPGAVYQAERYGNFTYTMTGLTPGRIYHLRLHFAENWWTAVGQRVFNVAINGTSVLANFDILAATGAQHKAIVREFDASASSGGQVVIAFTSVADSALVNGIEVLDLSPPPVCGDAIVTAPEQCDDGNLVNGDGCSATCQVEPSVNGPVSVNAGGPAVATFVADSGFVGGSVTVNWTGAIDTTAAPGAAPQEVYRAERYGDMTYTIAGLTPGASYDVRLHFAENWWTAPGQRTFDVALNGTSVLANFDVFAAAGAQHKAVIRELSGVANASGRIVIGFTSIVDSALVNGIEVLVPPLSATGPLAIDAGGGAAPPYVADVGFNGGTTVTNWTGAIDTAGVFRPAPAAVYQAERFGDMTYTIGGLAAGRWYHVRLHFAENWWTGPGQRKFNVAINGTAVLTNFDVFGTAGAAHKAVVQELVAAASGLGRVVIAFTSVVDSALVNGIEVLPAEFVQDGNGLVSLEAENRVAQTSASGHDWVFATDVAGYSGTGAMRGNPDNGGFFDPDYTTASPRLDYLVRFNRTGTHYVIVRAQGPHGMSDSLHVGLDGAAIASADRINLFPTTFAWQNNTADGVVATIDVPTVGLHTINVWMREDGVVFDKLVLTPSSTFLPSDTGPAETR